MWLKIRLNGQSVRLIIKFEDKMKINYLLFIIVALAISSCTVYRDIDLNRVRVGMSRQEVCEAIGKNSRYLSRGSFQSSSDGVSVLICQYGKNNILYTKKGYFLKFNSDVDKDQYKYLLYFFNDKLIYIKWGDTKDWDWQTEIDAFRSEMKEKTKSLK